MTIRPFAKPTLLRGCAITALLAGASLTAQSAQAQGFQASPTVVQGTVTIDDLTPGETRVTVTGTDAVIDWNPNINPVTGQAEIFLPDGNTGIFLGDANATTFAVLNRIIPGPGNNPAQFDGLVQAFLTDGNGLPFAPGGFVAFYSPSGIIVGPTGRFEVPQLMLTSQDVDIASFTDFANGTGPLSLNGSTGSIDLQTGATFTGTPEDSFMIVASPQITMAGDAYYNGSIAYVASTSVQMTHASGLFDIIIFGGAPDGLTIDHSGSSGGPSSTGAGDEHVIYGVTAAGFSGAGVSMLFGGNLGFDPAVSAGVVNGDIILSANFDVAGRTVDGDDNRQGADSFFAGRSFTPGTQGDILLSGVTATSNLLAISSHQTNLDATFVSSSFAGDLSLVGRQQAVVNAGLGQQVTVGGDLFVSARNFGLDTEVTSEEDAVGGFASVRADFDGLVSVTGQTMVAASALPGLNFNSNTIGSGTGGQAQILSEGGTIDLTGDVRMEAYARTDQLDDYAGNGAMNGGSVQFLSTLGGALSTQGNLTIDAGATTPGIFSSDDILLSDANGGDILIGVASDGGTVNIAGNVLAQAQGAVSLADLLTGTGSSGAGGNVQLSAFDAGSLSITGDVTLDASGTGGTVTGGGDAGQAVGGTTSVALANTSISIGGQLVLDSSAQGFGGQNGGDALGGFADIVVTDGSLSVGDTLTMATDALGGSVTSAGAGGDALSGDILLQAGANGQIAVAGAGGSTLGNSATGGNSIDGAGGLASGGDSIVSADGANASISFVNSLNQLGTVSGGNSTDGAGGNAIGGLNLATAQNGGIIAITDLLEQSAQISGGDGATGGTAIGADLGMLAAAGSQIDLGRYAASGSSLGGDGLIGDGGNATGANIALDIQGGDLIIAGTTGLLATGTGGNSTGGTGGSGFGGDVQVNNSSGLLDAPNSVLNINAAGFGGDALSAGQQAGDGQGGDVSFATLGGAVSNIDRFLLSADGRGGTGPDAIGGSGAGGTAQALVNGDGSQLIVAGQSSASASATGGAGTAAGSTGGAATGGTASLLIDDNSAVTLGTSTTLESVATGGDSEVDNGTPGAATSGAVNLTLANSGSLTASQVQLRSAATGGSEAGAATGVSGADATSGAVSINVTNSTLNASLNASSTASGGSSGSTLGGSASAGDVLLTANNALLDLGANSLLASDATGGTGNGGGSANSGNAGADLADTIADGATLAIRSNARGGGANPGGDAVAGDAFLVTTGSGSLTLAALDLNSNAQGDTGGTATSGTTELNVDLGLAAITDLTLNTDALGTADGTPGQVLLTSVSGLVDTQTITISAQGTNAGPEAQVSASDGGQITALTSLDADVTGDIAMTYANGGAIIGGIGPDDLSATFDVLAGGTISLDGDDGTIRSIVALESTYTSADIAVGADTLFGGGNVALVSTNTGEQAVLGGTTPGAGYSLLQAEADGISSDTLSISLPDVIGNDIDGIVNDLAFVGTSDFGFSRVDLLVEGSLDILGALALRSAGTGDVLAITAAQQVQITLSTGSVSVDDNGALSGLLQIAANRIVAADAALIAQIAADPTSQTVADALLDDGGASTPSNFIAADRVEISAGELVLTQNTGANGIYGGITVGAGGLLITQQVGAPGPLQVIAFGQRDVGGALTTNDDWFALVEFATDRAATYTAESTFNNCIIVTGACPTPPDPVDPEIPSTNHILIEEPVTFPEISEEGAASDFQFGFDFPRLLDTALISEEDLVDDPVTSGGDSAVHALSGVDNGANEEGED